MSDSSDKRHHHYERRYRAAVEGRHLPTNEELLRGCPFMGRKLGIDAQTYVERLLPRFTDKNDPYGHVRRALTLLTLAPDPQDCLDAADALDVIANGDSSKIALIAANASARCTFYAAALRDRTSAQKVAGEAAYRATMEGTTDDELVEYAGAALGWLIFAHCGTLSLQDVVPKVHKIGSNVVSALGQIAVRAATTRRIRNASLNASSEPQEAAEQSSDSRDGVVIIRAIGNGETSSGMRVAKEFGQLCGQPLSLTKTPNLVGVRTTLMTEFPHATNLIDDILFDVATSQFVRWRPTVLVGEPGSGKTTFANRLLDALGVPGMVYSCGGVGDASLGGAPRHWSTGEPSLPVALCKRWMTANPAVVLDEVEKVATSKHNGSLLDVLLGLLEPQSSSKWHDPYLEAEVDVSRVLWVMTANSLEGLPGALRDRCRIIAFPTPEPGHLEALAAAVLPKIAASQGLDQRWIAPLDPEELGALREHWSGGSIRHLTMLVEALLKARGYDQRQH